jgi:hypothetical protein
MSDSPEQLQQPVVAAAGRPSKFSQRLADAICAMLIEGLSLREICAAEGMPGKTTICKWLATREAFRDQYARAREMQAELMADELLDIADDGRNDWMERRVGDEVIEVVNQEAVQRSKLRVDTRKWIASKLVPKRYGESVDLKHSGKVDVSLEKMSNEDIERELSKYAKGLVAPAGTDSGEE